MLPNTLYISTGRVFRCFCSIACNKRTSDARRDFAHTHCVSIGTRVDASRFRRWITWARVGKGVCTAATLDGIPYIHVLTGPPKAPDNCHSSGKCIAGGATRCCTGRIDLLLWFYVRLVPLTSSWRHLIAQFRIGAMGSTDLSSL